jgi:histidinol dehydrogenase
MINISRFSFDSPRYRALLERYLGIPPEVTETVARILADVKSRGDEALFEYMLEFDGIDLAQENPLVTDEEFDTALRETSKDFQEALREACDNLFKFHQYQLPKKYTVTYPDGVVLERQYQPLEKVGICVPSAAAPLASSLYMNLIPALTAGVQEISIITAPRRGRIDSSILFTADFLGARKVYKISGAQGVAALAYGTASVQPVDKVVGPGGIYSQVAKQLLHGRVGTDSLAGPSEIAVIADQNASAEYIAADLLSQAEHGSGYEAAIAFCTSEEQAMEIKSHLERLAEEFGNVFIVDSLATAVNAVNSLAPEHVEIMCSDAEEIAANITSAGAIFIGAHSPESVGDYYCGTNHVLPTGGTARFSSGLNVGDFMRGYSVIRYTKKALATHGEAIRSLAKPEGMKAHMLSIAVRQQKDL